MRVMALSEGIVLKRSKRILPLALAVALTAGCSGESLDEFRPEINRSHGLLLDMAPVASGMVELIGGEVGGELGSGSGGNNSDINHGASDVEDPDDAVVTEEHLAPFSVDVVAASDYARYLRQAAVTPVQDAINSLSTDRRDAVYFRVFHLGYDYGFGGTSNVRQSLACNHISQGSVDNIGGLCVAEFIADWLSSLDSPNRLAVATARNAAFNTIRAYAVDDSTNWITAVTNGNLSPALLSLWGNERHGDAVHGSLGEYKNLLRSSEFHGVIPNVRYAMRKNEVEYVYVCLNRPIEGRGAAIAYEDHVRVDDLANLFTPYNQYRDRDAEVVSYSASDEHSAIFGYVDGHSVTLAVLGTSYNDTLEDLFGESNAKTLADTIKGLANYTEVDVVSDVIGAVNTIQNGTEVTD